MNSRPITGEMVISEILSIPGTKEVLAEYQLPCLSCALGTFEVDFLRLKEVATSYNLDLESLLIDLNIAAGNKKATGGTQQAEKA